MTNKAFPASPGEQFVLLPESFFTQTIPEIDDVAELKVILCFFYLLHHKQGHHGFITHEELLSYCIPVIGKQGFDSGLRLAVGRGVILSVSKEVNGRRENVYFANKEAMDRVSHWITPKQVTEPLNIFALYEQNIGLITPLVAEELKEAVKVYPAQWIEEAFREAVNMNKRSWKYIARILERWASEGKDSGEYRQGIKKGSANKYIKGRYGHLVKR
jgi:DnaD/phage-associated family protein